jgi:hypothetical protein
MDQLRKRHLMAVSLLERLGLDTIELDRRGDRFVYRGWTMPSLIEHNGDGKVVVRKGWIRVSLK